MIKTSNLYLIGLSICLILAGFSLIAADWYIGLIWIPSIVFNAVGYKREKEDEAKKK
jgi:hypothetical protein